MKIRSNGLCNLLKANELRTIFDILATSWLSGDNNSPSSLNYIGLSLNYIRPCSAYKATCHHNIGTCNGGISNLLYKKNDELLSSWGVLGVEGRIRAKPSSRNTFSKGAERIPCDGQ